MKKIFLTIAVMGAVVFASNAQQNVIGLNLGSLAFGEAQVSYERVLENQQSIHVGIPFYSRSVSAIGSDWSGDYKLNGIGVIPEYRFYMSKSKDAPRGFYAGPFLVYRNMTAKVEGNQNSTNEAVTGKAGFSMFGGGGQIGHQWLLGDVFSIDLNLGFGYYSVGTTDLDVEYTDGTTENYSGSINVSGVLPRLGISIGVAF